MGGTNSNMKLASLLLISASIGIYAQSDLCQPVHRECPVCPTGRQESFDAFTYEMASPAYQRLHKKLISFLTGDETLSSHVIMVEHPKLLKMTLQHYCCHTEEEADGMVEAVSEMGWNPLVNQSLGVISCAPVVNKVGQQPFPKGARAIDIGLSVSSKPQEGAYAEMLRVVRLVRHYSSKEFEPVIKIEPRINKFVL